MDKITLGIAGGGQLGKMMAEAAKSLGIKTIVLDPVKKSPASQIADDQIVGEYKNSDIVSRFYNKVDYLTFDVESVGVEKLKNSKNRINPSPQTLKVIQDKLAQKKFIEKLNLPTPRFKEIKKTINHSSLKKQFTFPFMLKARYHAFDGRGNALVKNEEGIKEALIKLKGKKIYAEEFIQFKKELAVQIVKSKENKLYSYPIVETIQKNNICHIVKYPAKIATTLQGKVFTIAKQIVKNLSGSGVYGIEFFLAKNNKILVNEIAPRVHNSGHWTIEGCATSQFENHVRAVCSLPIESTKPKTKAAVMINILGERNAKANISGIRKLNSLNGVFLHVYGKFETRIERKMGHITVIGNNLATCLKQARIARKTISI